jgi:predicted AAA+ superfamily ATPase
MAWIYHESMSYLPRHLSATVHRAMPTFPAVLVTGARQTGKTTLLRHECERTHAYVSLERPDRRAMAVADPLGFLRENPPPLILDEIQYVPSLLHYIKDRIDEDRRPGQWLMMVPSGARHSRAGTGL